MQLHPKHVGPIVMSFMVVFFVTGFITWLNVGLSDDFVSRWVKGVVRLADCCIGRDLLWHRSGSLLPNL